MSKTSELRMNGIRLPMSSTRWAVRSISTSRALARQLRHGFQRRNSSRAIASQWAGFVWMNSPFGGRNGLAPWLEKFFTHGNGVCLVPDRTSAPWWQAAAPKAGLILFAGRKIRFIGTDGKEGKSPAQGTCLMSAGSRGNEALYRAEANGLGFLARAAVAP